MPGLFTLGVYIVYLAVETWPDSVLMGIIYAGSGLFCITAAFKGAPLLRFLRHYLVLYREGIEITNGKTGKYLTWDEIGRAKADDIFYVLSIYDKSGNLVYAVDYYAENFKEFVACIDDL